MNYKKKNNGKQFICLIYIYPVVWAFPKIQVIKLQLNMFFREKLMSPQQPNPLNPTSAFAHIIIQDFGYVDIIYQVSCKDMSVPSGALKSLL